MTNMIKPDQIPQFTGNLTQLEKDYAGLKKDAGNVRDAGADVHSRFQGLSAYYRAPEAEQLFATTKPVKDRADGFADDLETVSSALSEYATEVRPLKEKLERLKTEATAFVESVKDDDEWEYDGDKVEEHNRLRDDVTATVAAFWAAERTCHNKIIALVPGGKKVVVGDGSDREGQYGFSAEDMKNAKLPWGDPVEEKHKWYEVGHWVKSFVWDGLIVDGIWGTIKGLGTLVGFGGWEAMGQAWKGLAQLATGLALTSIPGVGTMFWSLPDEKLPGWIRDSRTAMKETGKALVAWDQWGKNPARAAGAVTFNVLTTVFTGGAGGAASGAGKAGAVAKALGTTAKAIDPMTYIAKGAGAGLSKIGDISTALKGVGTIDIPALPEGAITLPEGAVRLPDGTVNLPEGTALPEGATRLPDGNVKLPDDATALPPGTIKLPAEDGAPVQYMDPDCNLLDGQGNIVQNAADGPGDIVDQPGTPGTTSPASGADTPRVDPPVREPALVGAGTATADNAGQVIRLGDDGLGDLGRVGNDVPTTPTVHAGGDLPGTGVGDNLPGGTANSLPGSTAGDGLPGGSAYDHGPGPSASHETPGGGGGDHGTGSHSEVPGGHTEGSGGGTSEPPGGGPERPSSGGGNDNPDSGGGLDDPGAGMADPPRVNEPLPEMTPAERAEHWEHLEQVEGRSPDEFDHLQRDPDKNGGISDPSKDEARVGLDLREQGRLPADIQRPTVRDNGEFYSPSTDRYYDIKGVHSDWPPFNNVRDKSQPFRGAYDPANNERWVGKLRDQIAGKGRIVILDIRNANQAAIDDIKSIVEKNGWEDDVIWYP